MCGFIVRTTTIIFHILNDDSNAWKLFIYFHFHDVAALIPLHRRQRFCFVYACNVLFKPRFAWSWIWMNFTSEHQHHMCELINTSFDCCSIRFRFSQEIFLFAVSDASDRLRWQQMEINSSKAKFKTFSLSLFSASLNWSVCQSELVDTTWELNLYPCRKRAMLWRERSISGAAH